MVKTSTKKNHLLGNQTSDDLESWYAAWVLEYYQVCSNDDPGMTLTYLKARSNLVPYAFVWEKVKQWIFSETIVVYDIKVGKCNQLNEYRRSRSYIDFDPNLSDSIFLNFFSSITTWPIGSQIYLESPWDEGTKACSNCSDHMTKMAIMSIYCKIL